MLTIILKTPVSMIQKKKVIVTFFFSFFFSKIIYFEIYDIHSMMIIKTHIDKFYLLLLLLLFIFFFCISKIQIHIPQSMTMSPNLLSQLMCSTLYSTKHIKPHGHNLVNTNRWLKQSQSPILLYLPTHILNPKEKKILFTQPQPDSMTMAT